MKKKRIPIRAVRDGERATVALHRAMYVAWKGDGAAWDDRTEALEASALRAAEYAAVILDRLRLIKRGGHPARGATYEKKIRRALGFTYP